MRIGSILLAAGRGRRLRPLTDETPKPVIPLLDVPLGSFPLSALQAVARPTLVNLGHLPDEVERELGGLGDVVFSRELPEPWGTAGTLRAALPLIGDRVVVANADLLTDLDLDALIEAHEQARAPATVAVAPVEAGADLTVDGSRVTGFVDRRTSPGAGGARYLGAAVFDRNVVAGIPTRRPLGLGETVLRSLVDAGRLAVFAHEGYAVDVGTPARYLQASLDLLAGIGPVAPRPIAGNVVDVDGGRGYIGEGARVEGHLGPGAVVLRGAYVMRDAWVRHAIVWHGETVCSGEHVEDAIYVHGRPLGIGL